MGEGKNVNKEIEVTEFGLITTQINQATVTKWTQYTRSNSSATEVIAGIMMATTSQDFRGVNSAR